LRWTGICYRAHDPRWSWAPLSGEGAAANGGRFNPRGVPALYLALSVEGMLAETSQGFAHRFEPLTICSYAVDVDDLVDLRSDEARSAAGVDFGAMACAWAFDLAERRRPASWSVAERLIAKGASGILTPSFARTARPDMANLVLWRWGPTPPHKVELYDPNGRLRREPV
jgi:RES domain-containing protein